ncbi:hypothetical protein BU24DRAFT_187 [Aaosphaeria arxii CBS 175.79]|uniref:Uncharacterized protein n=1 Tax=Aaosphaeria arxii CBS 175.79 TaxID=1450172 RepID=A0A6A5Y515_9PLEO|nr:uncharacterized protein BU24DRAFT_187 [Aaosphaeria arxii CBS 175.79]KAF2020356.1 hypothetical protein BU24DRAFT_187 [Aaosphaeria arxii CBS 175.79]
MHQRGKIAQLCPTHPNLLLTLLITSSLPINVPPVGCTALPIVLLLLTPPIILPSSALSSEGVFCSTTTFAIFHSAHVWNTIVKRRRNRTTKMPKRVKRRRVDCSAFRDELSLFPMIGGQIDVDPQSFPYWISWASVRLLFQVKFLM